MTRFGDLLCQQLSLFGHFDKTFFSPHTLTKYMTHLILVPMHTCFLCLSIHSFVPHLINQDHMNLCAKISQTSTWICANFPPLCSTLTQDLNCTSNGRYYSLGGYEWERSCHNATKRKQWNTGCCTYDSSIMLHVLQMHWGKMRRWRWGGGGGRNLVNSLKYIAGKNTLQVPQFSSYFSFVLQKPLQSMSFIEYHVKWLAYVLKLWCPN